MSCSNRINQENVNISRYRGGRQATPAGLASHEIGHPQQSAVMALVILNLAFDSVIVSANYTERNDQNSFIALRQTHEFDVRIAGCQCFRDSRFVADDAKKAAAMKCTNRIWSTSWRRFFGM
jgi:hypothetical protein